MRTSKNDSLELIIEWILVNILEDKQIRPVYNHVNSLLFNIRNATNIVIPRGIEFPPFDKYEKENNKK